MTAAQQVGLFAPPPARPPEIPQERVGLFHAVYDANARYTALQKLQNAIEGYRRKFGAEPAICLTSEADAAELARVTDFPVRAESFIGRHTFYIGVEG